MSDVTPPAANPSGEPMHRDLGFVQCLRPGGIGEPGPECGFILGVRFAVSR